MSALLLLLALLSLATLFSRQNWGDIVSQFLFFPLLIMLGYILSPKVLGVFLPSTLDALMPALRVALTWLSFLMGLRVMRYTFQRERRRNSVFTFLYGGLSVTVAVLASYGLLLWFASRNLLFPGGVYVRESFLPLALIIGGAIGGTGFTAARKSNLAAPNVRSLRRLQFLAGFDEIVGFVLLCLVIGLWPASDALFFHRPFLNLILPVALGAILGVTEKLSADFKSSPGTPGRLAMFGLATLGTGLAVGAGIPEAPVGFFFGLTLALLNRGAPILDRYLLASDRPVRMVVFLLAGAFLDVTWTPALLGAVLALVRLAYKRGLLVLWPEQDGGRQVPLAAVAGFSEIGLPLALSFTLAAPSDVSKAILLTVAVCQTVTDVFTYAIWPHSVDRVA